MTTKAAPDGESGSAQIDRIIARHDDWRGATLARMRGLIQAALPDVLEEVKWMGTPVWSSNGIICTGETYKAVVKLTFMKGASVADPAGLFNASLDGNARRAIDIREGEELNAADFKALISAAAALNALSKTKKAKSKTKTSPTAG